MTGLAGRGAGSTGLASSHTARLPDGRTLGFQVFGAPGGPPVLYCHGWPSGRLEAGLMDSPPALLIAVDRPGYGLSTPRPGAGWLDLADDMAFLMDHLGIGTFAVAGVSGGGPLAAACAYKLSDRVSTLALVCAVPPADHEAGGGEFRWLLRGARLGPIAPAALGLARAVIFSPLAEAAVFGGLPPGRDAAVLTKARRGALIEVFRTALRPGIAGAMADARRYARAPGFNVAAISCPTAIWHGARDHLVSADAADFYARIPRSRIRLCPDDGHYSLAFGLGRTIVEDLIGQTGRRNQD